MQTMVMAMAWLYLLPLKAQPVVTLSIENQQVNGTNFEFDIFLTRHSTSTMPIYLNDSDFVLFFNSGNFTNPVLSKVPNPTPPFGFIQNGYCNFVSTTYTNPNDPNTQLNCQKTYYDNTSPTIIGNLLIVNLQGLPLSTQSDFDTKVSNINDSPSTHRLGRFSISGITNPNGTAGLNWKVSGGGLETVVTVFTETTDPWHTDPIDIFVEIPAESPLPVALHSFGAHASKNSIDLHWASSYEIDFDAYHLERATDGEPFSEIASVPAIGGDRPTPYGFPDFEVEPNTTYYYRLSMVDLDGSVSYSPVVSAMLAGPSALAIRPNPVVDGFAIDLATETEGEAIVEVWNSLGQLVYSRSHEMANGQNPIWIESATWPSTSYFVRARMGHRTWTGKLLKN